MEVPRHARTPAPSWLLIASGIAALLTGLSLAVLDKPVARFIGTFEAEKTWTRIVEALEWTVLLPPFRWLLPVLLALGMLASILVPRWRRSAPAWMFVAASHLLEQLATNYLKVWTGRLRPSEWLARGVDESFGWVDAFSFPSGHVTIFASFFVPLVVLVPRAWPLLSIVAYAMVARVAVNAHFLSDVFGALSLVLALTWVFGGLIRPLRAI